MGEWQGFYSTFQVSRLARIPRSTLYDWKTKNILKPSVRILSGDEVIDEGYSYADLTILRLSRAVRDKKLNMRSVCIALRHLIDRFGSPNRGWADVHVYIANNHVYAEKLDEWDVTAADMGGQRIDTSSPSVLYWWVEGLELDAGIRGGEAPVHPYCVPVALLLPRSHLPPQSALVGNTAVQALPGHHPDFDLGHIQPTAMLGSVMDKFLAGLASRKDEVQLWFSSRWVEGLRRCAALRQAQRLHTMRLGGGCSSCPSPAQYGPCAGSPRPPVA